MVNWGENVRKSSIQIKEYIFILLYKIKKIVCHQESLTKMVFEKFSSSLKISKPFELLCQYLTAYEVICCDDLKDFCDVRVGNNMTNNSS
ncbi:hypothetical protein KUTeg_010293 [Tegillarca granosa]|uniref:Uncharacterized protein n=1 Tax=Tegillarca granosa TaxID=220873 RepID=A0ABQ9F6A5_TEGGR|nr:hypothetical protein KUTeg_010293 [Tegillarca granosa]